MAGSAAVVAEDVTQTWDYACPVGCSSKKAAAAVIYKVDVVN